jgi:mRNA interferase YafQ
MLKIRYTKQFKKDYNTIKKRGYDLSLLEEVLAFLINGKELPNKYKDHQLAGNFKGYRECHILPDWLLIYKIEEDVLILTLTRTGTHSDLF